MTTLGWVLVMIAFLIVELIFVYIVIHKAYRFKHTVDPIDTRVNERQGPEPDNNHTEFTK